MSSSRCYITSKKYKWYIGYITSFQAKVSYWWGNFLLCLDLHISLKSYYKPEQWYIHLSLWHLILLCFCVHFFFQSQTNSIPKQGVGSYSVSISTFCSNFIIILNNYISTCVFGTLSYSVSISAFVQIPNQLNSYLWGCPPCQSRDKPINVSLLFVQKFTMLPTAEVRFH